MAPPPYMTMELIFYATTFVRWVEGVAMADMSHWKPDSALR
jgi:hypothetical protein